MPKASTAAKFGDPRLPSRFWEKVAVQPDGCWRWTAAKNRNGYSKFFWNGTTPSAHAVAYKALIGDLREGFQVDHRCHDPNTCRGEECLHRLCVNPAHLAAVTRAENMSIGRARRAKSEKTHCKQGHEFTESNTYVNPRNGSRTCRTCYRGSYERRAERKRIRRAQDSTNGR